jgi:hypothetical protein
MRYLYGDSVPFPPQYDFLGALEAFCTQAARVVRADAEARAMRKTADEGAVARTRAADQLEAFHREAVGALRDGSKDSTQPLVHDYVQQVTDLAQRIADEARRQATQTSELEASLARSEGNRRQVEVREALEKLLAAVRLPVSQTEITMTLTDGHNDFTASFTHEGGLVATFTLGGDDVEEWKRTRQVRDLAQNVTLPVGVKRSLFKRTVAAETISLDEYVIGGFELRDEGALIRLRRKGEQTDTLVFRLTRVEDRLVAEVHYPGDAEAESGLPAVLDETSAAELERLWQMLRAACAPVLARKKRLVRLALAGDDVFEHDMGSSVIGLIVGVIAPIVGEVARRSPNTYELSLKIENDTGRREEIYLRKAQLVSALATVDAKDRRVFDPLGLIASEGEDVGMSITNEVNSSR